MGAEFYQIPVAMIDRKIGLLCSSCHKKQSDIFRVAQLVEGLHQDAAPRWTRGFDPREGFSSNQYP